MSRKKAFPIHVVLMALVGSLLVPVILVSAFLLSRFADGERSRQQADALEIAHTIAAEIDRELSGLQGALQVVTTYISLDARDWPTVYRQASEVKGFLGVEIIVKDAAGQQFVNTRLPVGSNLPASLPPGDLRALREKKPVVSDLFTGTTAGGYIVSLNAPILRNGEVTGLVNMAVEPARLSAVLQGVSLPSGWVAALVDHNGKIVARSHQAETFVGQSASRDLLENATRLEGAWTGTTVDGTPVLSAYARSSLSGWRIAVGAPISSVEAPLRRTLLWLMLLGAAGLAASTLVAGICGRQIARSLRQVADLASSIASGSPIAPIHTRIKGVNAISEALASASRELQDRARKQTAAEEDLRAETNRLDTLNRIGQAIASELDLEKLVQKVTDAGVELSGAAFGAFFYNVPREGETLTLYTISGVPREEFSKFPMPRGTQVFAPTLGGKEVVRSDDITQDPRYGKNTPYKGMPEGHLPVRSYLAVPVVSRAGEVLGALFFGHGDAGRFTQRHEDLLVGIAAQAAVAVDNSRLYEQARLAEREARSFSQELEVQVAERTHSLQLAHTRLVEEVAQRERAEEQLRQAQKMEAVGQLTGGIAHDFNNLLAVIIGSLQLIERRLDKGETGAVYRYLANANAGADRAVALTHRLLAFSRKQTLAPEPVDLNKLINGTSELLRRTLGEHIQIETVLAGGLWLSHIDRHQLENALINLAVNARDAMPEGGKLTLETANCHLDERYGAANPDVPPGQYVMVALTDTGAGMDDEVIKRAFEPFYTTKEVGQGTGLGLSQVYGFVKQSHGHVKIYSELGHGTTVKIYLPRFRGAAEEAEQSPAPVHVQQGSRELRVLLVEDDPSVRQMSAESVRELGYNVIEADGAAAALRILDSGAAIDLLFTDVVMPEMNGRRLADEALRRKPNLKILFTTGFTRNAIVHNGLLDANVHLLAKPYTLSQLARKFEEVLAPDRGS
ncbi:MAG: integral rane sensor hybrid histidine kinase [Hyphomicrobiales bacterium]|nr:integral rane sensor hybrid histidine kinase [Hyphomicrobiales bacterium]